MIHTVQDLKRRYPHLVAELRKEWEAERDRKLRERLRRLELRRIERLQDSSEGLWERLYRLLVEE